MSKGNKVEVVHKILVKKKQPSFQMYVGMLALVIAPSYFAYFTGSDLMGWVAFVWSFVFALSFFIQGLFILTPLSIEEAQAKLDKIKAEAAQEEGEGQ